MPDINDIWDDDEDIAPFVRPREHAMPDDSRAKHGAVSPMQAENERLREALSQIVADAEWPVAEYHHNGPECTSPNTGIEYYSASYVIDKMEELAATARAALEGDR